MTTPIIDGESEPAQRAAGLARTMLDAEAERQALQVEDERAAVLDDEFLPGVGSDELALPDGVKIGGAFTVVVLLLIQFFDQLENAALAVLAPDIRDSLGVSNGTIVFFSAATGAFLALGVVPMGWLADRYRRGRIISAASAACAVLVMSCGLVANAFAFFWARLGVGVARSNGIPVQGSLIADAYPIGVRGRISAALVGAARMGAVFSPLLVGGIASLAGGSNGWRMSFLVIGVPLLPLAIVAWRMPEPDRGHVEEVDVLGDEIERPGSGARALPMAAAVARLTKIRTYTTFLLAFAALGFGLIIGPVLQNLHLDREFGLDAFDRGVVGSIGGLAVLIVLPFTSRRYDALFRTDPTNAVKLLGLLIIPAGLVLPVQYAMPNAALFTLVGIVPSALLVAAFALVTPLLQSVVPPRLRGMGLAFGALLVFLVGATIGGLLAAMFTNALGPGGAMLAIGIPSTVLGGAFVLRGASTIKGDLSLVVTELRDDQEESDREHDAGSEIPAIQVTELDYAYGPVQVLFNIDFEVRRGEVLALLGSNGAGKSTILRAIAGLGRPTRGAVRLDGTPITYMSPEQRVRLGIRLLPGGKGVFPGMSVRENLEIGAYIYRSDREDRDRRMTRVLEMFPDLASRQDQLAGSMSGGQQQMLALAITLLHDADVLLIDELSLGLSPIVVQELLKTIEHLKSEGMTIVIVEQSLNIALAIADRAVFVEKGQIRFEGSADELRGRDDLVRAVFLGAEGG